MVADQIPSERPIEFARSWRYGLVAALLALGLIAIWLFWGRAMQMAIGVTAAGIGLALWRYPEISAGMAGFLILSYIASFVPGSTTLFFAGVYVVLILRKLQSQELSWRYGNFFVPVLIFVGWYYSSILWADTHMPWDGRHIIRILLTIFVVSELLKSTRTYLAFFIGAAFGLIFTSVSAIKTAVEFYTSGVADQIANTVTSIESSRFFGHWDDPNFMSMTIIAYLGGVMALWRSKLNFWIRSLMFVAAVLSIAATLMSLSRTGLIGCVIVLGMMLAIERHRFVLAAVVAGLVAVLLTVLPVDLFGRVFELLEGTDKSSSERLGLLLSGWKLFWNSPIIGSGIGSFESDVMFLMPYLPYYFFSHNTFIDIAVDSGLIGLGLYIACLVFAFRGLSWRQWHVDPSDIPAMLNAGMRASLVATVFAVATMTTAGFIPFWVFFTMCAFFGVTVRNYRAGQTGRTS